ncbi:MAG TPA: ATP synthase F1 subunit delta [Vicinamibacterales bacterium]|nr:ATP synthase F1 subunit delta [Vicinamibacterales bacterium]
MTNRTAATRYARALVDVAVEERVDLDRVERELASIVDLFADHKLLSQVLLNPVVPVPRKRAAMDALTARGELLPVVAKLLGLLAERDRLVLLPELLASYRDRLLDYRNVVRAELTTTVPLDADQLKAIETNLTRASGRTVSLSTKVDPSIIGGVVTRIGSTIYDGSIIRQLQRMKEKLSWT